MQDPLSNGKQEDLGLKILERSLITRAVEAISFVPRVARAIIRPFSVSAIGVFVTIAHIPFTFVDILIWKEKYVNKFNNTHSLSKIRS